MSTDIPKSPYEPAKPSSADEAGTGATGESASAAPSNVEALDPGQDSAPARSFEDLTISELLTQLWRSPISTASRFRRAIHSTRTREQVAPILWPADDAGETASHAATAARSNWRDSSRRLLQSEYPTLALYLLAFVFALLGSTYARGTADISRSDGYSLQVATPYLWLGFLVWLVGDICRQWPRIRNYWRRCDRPARILWWARVVPAILVIGALFRFAQSMSAPVDSAVDTALSALLLLVAGLVALFIIGGVFRRLQVRSAGYAGQQSPANEQIWVVDRKPLGPPAWRRISRRRKFLVILATCFSLVVWANTGGNRIEPPTMLIWLASIVTWALVFAPLRGDIFDWGASTMDKARRFSLRGNWLTILAFVLTLILGASFLFDRLDAAPPEMISDMVVNIVDAYRIHRGEDYPIFLGNNGGREPIQLYVLAFMSGLPGLNFDRTTLVLVTALEGFLTLPVMFWFAVEVIGKHRRRQALVVGMLATALLAVSYWHVALARQGLRIPLAPLFTALSAVFFVRALRHNRRTDFILAGITLSLGLYSYKSLRMLPLVYVMSIALALFIRDFAWRTKARYLLNLAVLAFMAGVVFLPMFRFWIEEPYAFTQRATTRMFGDLPTTDEERVALLREGGATFLRNIRNGLLMFHHTHDNTWVSAIPGQPAMDPVTGALLVLGASAWLGLLVSKRDPVVWFVPILFFVMVLLTALAIAFPIEVPSLQRASGAIPPAYLIAALPLALLCRQIYRTLPRVLGLAAAIGFAIAVIVTSYQYNRGLYFGDFMDNYHRSAQNHAEAGQILQGFADSDGAYGNAFIISSPHWWDHRAVGVEAGAIRWDNSIVDAARLPRYIEAGLRRWDEYRLLPDRDLLFFFAPRNAEAPGLLRDWFPAGRQLEIRQEPAEKSFFIYRVPALGEEGVRTFLADNR